MYTISPTRMNLLQKRAQMRLVQHGVELLKRKRDALLKEFMEGVRPLVSARGRISEELHKATTSLIMSLAVDGLERVESAALACNNGLSIDIKERNICGIRVPEVKTHTTPPLLEGGYSGSGTSPRIDETASEFRAVIESIISMAPMEIKLKRLGREIRKTSRRVNALEQILIPGLAAQVRFIKETLEERAREDVFRLKRLKGKKERQAKAKPTPGE